MRFVIQPREIPLLVLIRTLTKGMDISSPDLFLFAKLLKSQVLEFNATIGTGHIISMMSYYDFRGTLLDNIKDQFVAANHQATFIRIGVQRECVNYERFRFIEYLQTQIRDLNPDFNLFSIEVAGFDAIIYEGSANNIQNIFKLAIWIFPLGLILIALTARSWRLSAFSFFNLCCTILTSTTLVAFMAQHGYIGHLPSATLQFMVILSAVMSMDWALFLNHQYRVEVYRGGSSREAAFLALNLTGAVVLISGITLIVMFLGLCILSASSMQLDAICCVIGVSTAMLVALTVTPAIWLVFSDFSSDFDVRCCKRRTVEDLDREASRLGLDDVVSGQNPIDSQNRRTSHSLSAPLISPDEGEETPVISAKKLLPLTYLGCRFRFTRWITRFPNNVFSIVLVYILVIPLVFQVRDFVINQDLLAALPYKSDLVKTHRYVLENFQGGSFAPYYLMISTKNLEDKDKVLTPSFFVAANYVSAMALDACKALDDRFRDTSIQSPAFIDGSPVSYGEAKTFLGVAKSLPCNPMFAREVAKWWKNSCALAKTYAFEWNRSVNSYSNAMLATITTPFFPFGRDSRLFIGTINGVVDSARRLYPELEFEFVGVEVRILIYVYV